LEFSNIGHDVILDPAGQSIQDAYFDGFLYFRDFGLDVLTWKLGGHLDDHHEKASMLPRRGFFEVALGCLSIEADISKPITDDPWLLNQIIHQVREFYRISPHSVHISLQISGRRPAKNRLVPLSVMKCLFALAGDPVRRADGSLIIQRLLGNEIISKEPCPHMMFSEVSRRTSSSIEAEYSFVRNRSTRGHYVQQFKFLRLNDTLNYEPIIMALKGIQISLSPSSFLTGEQFEKSRKHRELYESLVEWGSAPTLLSDNEIEEFLSAAYEGLQRERRNNPAHSGAYIAWSIAQLRKSLAAFNKMIEPETIATAE
ncbi:MAG: hypothetical protein J7M14_02315, partial [Planctomycetes bacterium]|nr:hypothetical protein [Planctomycetota bacterium]